MISILMTSKKFFVALVTLFSIMTNTTSMAQQQKLLTLEELNFGGVNYRKFVPERLYSTWWGEQLMYQDVEETGMIDMKSGERRKLFTLDDVNSKLDFIIDHMKDPMSADTDAFRKPSDECDDEYTEDYYDSPQCIIDEEMPNLYSIGYEIGRLEQISSMYGFYGSSNDVRVIYYLA